MKKALQINTKTTFLPEIGPEGYHCFLGFLAIYSYQRKSGAYEH
jgi:hypothetical protein